MYEIFVLCKFLYLLRLFFPFLNKKNFSNRNIHFLIRQYVPYTYMYTFDILGI